MEQHNSENTDELNLYDLWNVILKRKKLIIGLFLVAVIAETIISFSQPKIYRGEAVLRIFPLEIATSNITAREMADIIGKIDGEKKDKLLPKTHGSITSVIINTLKDSKDKIEVILETSDIQFMQPALSEIIEYFNSINLVNLNVKDEQEKLLKRSAELSSVINESSELLITYHRLLKAGKLVPVGFNPIELNKKITDIKMEKLLTEQVIRRLRGGVELVREIDIGHSPVRPRIKMNVAISGLLSLLVGIFSALFLEFIEKARRRRETE